MLGQGGGEQVLVQVGKIASVIGVLIGEQERLLDTAISATSSEAADRNRGAATRGKPDKAAEGAEG
ncbi:hypothetical protein CLAM6_34950 [Cobetia sp. AM6]|nr:hypothetical protein CLAM6_34950 [Cobetia sp. AM6]